LSIDIFEYKEHIKKIHAKTKSNLYITFDPQKLGQRWIP